MARHSERDPSTGRFAPTGSTFGQTTGVNLGVGVSGGWGEADVVSEQDGAEDAPHGSMGDGHFIRIDEDAWRALLHVPQVVDAITQRAQDICDAANSLVAMDPRAVERLGQGEEAYKVTVQNRVDTTRARARVKAANLLGIIDDAHNSTLLKAMLTAPSDPIPEGAGPVFDTVQTPEYEGGGDLGEQPGDYYSEGDVVGFGGGVL